MARRKHSRETLTLRLPLMATPRRVAEITAAMADLAERIHGNSNLTLVVENLNLRATLRAQSEEADKGLRLVKEMSLNPMACVQDHPGSEGVADGLAKLAERFVKQKPSFFEGKHKIAKLDEKFVQATKAAAHVQPKPTDVIEGGLSVVSAVLRAGRLEEGGPASARICVEGGWLDVRIGSDDERGFYDALRHGREVPIDLTGRWRRNGEDELVLDRASLVAVGIDADWEPISGAELLERAKTQPRLSDEDFEALRRSVELGE